MYDTYPATSNMTAIGAQQASDVPRISRLTGGLQQTINAHIELANLMEQRLHNVLVPSSPTQDVSGAENAKPRTSPLASDLETFEMQLHELSNRYNDILNRLEL